MNGKMSGEIGPSAEYRWPTAGRWSGPRARITESERLVYLLGVEVIAGRRTRSHQLAGFSTNRLFG